MQHDSVIIVGAGPTGMTLAAGLLEAGIGVVMIDASNEGVGGGARDYIYWNKDKLKLGIMKKFTDTLASDAFKYFGNVKVGQGSDLALNRLLDIAPVVLTCGSRGPKDMRIDGFSSTGVYDANMIVRSFNARWLHDRTSGRVTTDIETPPIGAKVGLIGMGNVVADIVRHISALGAIDNTQREVSILVRRGPFANKITTSEMKAVLPFINKEALLTEIKRILPMMIAADTAGETGLVAGDAHFEANLDIVLKAMAIKRSSFDALKPLAADSPAIVSFQFFSQVSRINDINGQLHSAVVAKKASSGTRDHTQPYNTLIFSVGTAVDETLGLLVENGGVAGDATEAYKVADKENLYFAGWVRRPSIGLAGVNIKDAKQALPTVIAGCQPSTDTKAAATQVVKQIAAMIEASGKTDYLNETEIAARLNKEIEANQVLSFL
jgi:cation diffusion facilitator CzcD-associated flavoprotein CzcO